MRDHHTHNYVVTFIHLVKNYIKLQMSNLEAWKEAF
jgi:hypothetical protein